MTAVRRDAATLDGAAERGLYRAGTIARRRKISTPDDVTDDPRPRAAPRPRRQTKAEQREETVSQILDAAEYLFSRRGFFGVTLKDIAQQVGVHTSLLHYYFDDKKQLFDEVIARRAPHVNQTRLEVLDRYEREAGDNITVEGALHAFLDTNLDIYDQGEVWQNYGALGAVLNATPDWGAKLMDENFDSVALRLIELLRKALPDCPEEDLFWGFHFVSGALTLTLGRTARIDRLSDGRCSSDDFAAIKRRMADFMAGGFRAICAERAAARAR